MTNLYQIDLNDRIVIDRIIMTAHDMTYYPTVSKKAQRIEDEQIIFILNAFMVPGSELFVCDLGRYTLSNSDGEYVFYATLEMI